jgi:hypothetical protein
MRLDQRDPSVGICYPIDEFQQEIKFVSNGGCMERDHGATFRDAANRTIHDGPAFVDEDFPVFSTRRR